jgi:hypothetical protein
MKALSMSMITAATATVISDRSCRSIREQVHHANFLLYRTQQSDAAAENIDIDQSVCKSCCT